MTPITCSVYAEKLAGILRSYDWNTVEVFAEKLHQLSLAGGTLYICGNGGSAGNAIHLANDFLYGICPSAEATIKVEALSANAAVLTCLGNDTGFENIYAHQVKTKGKLGDILWVLSGSGNSPNIVKAVEQANATGVYTVGTLGYKGGKCLELVNLPIHFAVDDMQIAEDLQLVVGHMLMRLLNTSLGNNHE
ncbi:SIS domain-containing protein [Alteromonas sp. RKMC-009]|uniref:SIS domain-containing protein n=1 Tax=Alteromonas sp. RKMC-009 TaxID=2267264 RepID=UPI001E2C6A58|nr:SIS domain-containing protein [Alteromonas sp. RKMC-009]